MTTLVYIGSDHAGFGMKNELIKHIRNSFNMTVVDCGTSKYDRCDYPDYSVEVSKSVLMNVSTSLGIAVCGSGIGISIGCNKINGIRCGLAHDNYTAEYAKK